MVGIQIHSVDNNAAVPWEWHTYKNTTSRTEKYAAGYFFRYGGSGTGLAAGASGGHENTYYISLAPIELKVDEEGFFPFIPIRDDMVLEAYAFESEDSPIKLGDPVYSMEPKDVEGRSTFTLTNMEVGARISFEIVGIIRDCDVEYINMSSSGIDDFMPLTTKVLVRLIK